jgi:ATPase subunit of ABC transporter with duplicated ATPase domains
LQKIEQSLESGVAYIDQCYDIVNRELTVFENLEQKVSGMQHEQIYKQLGRFQFREDFMHKKASELSGGEIARLAFAIVTTKPLDLLVLDEPTNNLDIETVDVISNALQYFGGALLVVSHDVDFLEKLEIKQWCTIRDAKLFVLRTDFLKS